MTHWECQTNKRPEGFAHPRADLSPLQGRGPTLSSAARMFTHCFNRKTATNMFTLHSKFNWNQMVKISWLNSNVGPTYQNGRLPDTNFKMGRKHDFFYNTKTHSVSRRLNLWRELLPLELSKERLGSIIVPAH